MNNDATQPPDDTRIALFRIEPLTTPERRPRARARAQKQAASATLRVGEGVTVDLRRPDGLVTGLVGRVVANDATAIRLRVLGHRFLRDRTYLETTPHTRVIPWPQISAARVVDVSDEGQRR